MNSMINILAVLASGFVLSACKQAPNSYVSHGSFNNLSKPGLFGSSGQRLSSGLLSKQHAGCYVWETQIKNPSLTGKDHGWSFYLSFIKINNNSSDGVYMELPKDLTEGIKIKYSIKNNSGKTIVRLNSCLNEWKPETVSYWTGANNSVFHEIIRYWVNYVENPRIAKEKDIGNVFFYADKDQMYTIRVEVYVHQSIILLSDVKVQIDLETGGSL